MTAATDYILETRDLRRDFKGFVAVDGVNLRVRRGAIHALIGPNGAGKTTCFNLLTKFLPPSAGTILYNGIDITGEKPAMVARRGMVRSFQISAVFPHLTVLENVRVALQRTRSDSFNFWSSERRLNVLNDRAMALLSEVDLASFADTVTVEMPYGRKRALEIATTLANHSGTRSQTRSRCSTASRWMSLTARWWPVQKFRPAGSRRGHTCSMT